MKWSIAVARQKFSELLRRAGAKPQAIYNREDLVAVVIDAETYREFSAWNEERNARTIADSFAELREICGGEADSLPEAPREDRDNAFLSPDGPSR